MNWQQKKELTDALLQCPCISHRDGREAVIHELPYRDRIRRRDTGWEDVINIITTAYLYPGGVLNLIDIVRGFEGEASRPLVKVEEIVRRIFPEPEPTKHSFVSTEHLPVNQPGNSVETALLPAGFSLKQRFQITEEERGLAMAASEAHHAQCIAYDVQLDKSVLINAYTLKSEAENKQFAEQAARLVAFAHPDLPKVHDYIVDDSEYKGRYLVMDWVQGETLAEMLHNRGGALTQRESLIYTIQICEAVQYLHQQNPPYLHLDITPQTIKVHHGQARFASLNTGSPLPFTPGYTPIEQTTDISNVSEASDIYALGAILYTLLTGQSPPDSRERLRKDKYIPPHKIRTLKIRKEISRSVSEAVTQALALHKVNRPESVAGWAKTLQDILYQETELYLNLCSQLENFLATGRWLEADDETANLMLSITNKEKDLRSRDIQKLPCSALQVIDGLWERYSDGQFGLRVQQQIWREITEGISKPDNKHFRKFGEQIGWCVRDGQLKYNNFLFKSNVEKGHLPSLRNTVSNNPTWFPAWQKNIKSLLSRPEGCLSN